MNHAVWQKTTLLAGRLLSASAALFGLSVSASQAQQAATGVAADDSLNEITVTATRREETISRAPLSIIAFTQQALAAQEIKDISDLQRITPGLGLTFGNLNPNGQSSADTNISLRGVSSTSGAATTGVYIDDVPTHKLAVTGSGMGAEYPQLFDLERVEVLRGPQGTLYGGSTMGGAIRFISAQPSLTDYSGNVKLEGGFTQGGDPTYEVGAAFGGPIIADTLGFRLTVWTRNQGGYVDHVSRFTGDTLATDTNRGESDMGRAQLLWSPVEALKVKASIFFQTDEQKDSDYYWFNSPGINAPAVGFTAAGKPCALKPVTDCVTVLPAHTYPAYNMFGPYNTGDEIYNPATGAESALLQPRTDHFYMPSVNIDYDAGPFTAHSITGYQSDSIYGLVNNSYRAGAPAFSNTPAYPANFYYTFPQFLDRNQFGTYHDATSEELRFVSNPNGTPFSWIAGLYYYTDRLHYGQVAEGNLAQEFAAVQHATPQTLLGYPLPSNGVLGVFNSYNNTQNKSVYLDMNYAVLENLKLEAGIRYSRDDLDIKTYGYYLNNKGLATATVANGGEVAGNSTGSATTPKAGVTYQINDRDMVYATASKGYRPGGYNAVPQFVSPACQVTLAQLGLGQPPTNYSPDSVWTYELGSKIREMDGRLQLDSSIYRTNWSNVQTQLTIPSCGQYTGNASSAVVQGVDLQGAIKLGDATFSAAAEFTDATYTRAVSLPTSGPEQLAIAGRDRLLGVPLWSGSAGMKYDLHIADKTPFIRADYNFASGVRRSTGPGTVGYTATVYKAESTNFLTIGAGVNYTSQLQLLFNVKNVTNTQTPLLEYGGVTTVRNSPLLFGTTFRPREYDFDVLYRF
jgi:outer membrane receptor protein involved in Fe transport